MSAPASDAALHAMPSGARILITTQVFPPEIHPTAVMVHELATGLAARGFEVTVAAGLPHHPDGVLQPGFTGRLRWDETKNGYRTVRFWHPTTPRRSIPTRIGVMLWQMCSTVAAAVSTGRHDVVMSFGGPPLMGPVLSGLLASAWRVPMVTVIHDLYPDVAIDGGSVRNPAIIGCARIAERAQYRLSDRLVVLGEATRTRLLAKKGITPSQVDVLPVWLDPEEIKPGERDNPWRRAQGLGPERFVVLYSGTAGIVSGAEFLPEVARKVPADVTILLVGGGAAWNSLKARKDRGELPANLVLLPFQPREVLSQVQASSDLSLVTLAPGRGRTSVPSKVQGYMAAGRPVLAAVDHDCDTALLVSRGGFGMVVPPHDPEALAAGIAEARSDAQRLAAWGARGRAVFEEHHGRDNLIDRYASMLRDLSGRGGA